MLLLGDHLNPRCKMTSRLVALIRITNPNPSPIEVVLGKKTVVESIKPRESVTWILSAGLRLRYTKPRPKDKPALAVLSVEGGTFDGEEWVQAIGDDPVHPHPDKGSDYVDGDNLPSRVRDA